MRQGAAILALLVRISEQLEQLPKAIATAQHRGAALTAADRHTLAMLLPAISEAVGSAPFTVRSLVEDTVADDEFQARLDLVFDGSLNPRRLGKLFARADGFALDGLAVTCEARMKDGLLWRVSRV